MDVHIFTKTVNALKASPYELLKDLEAPEPDSVLLILPLHILPGKSPVKHCHLFHPSLDDYSGAL